MKRDVLTLGGGVAMIIMGVLCPVVGTQVYGSNYLIAERLLIGRWIYPLGPPDVPISPNATVRLRFFSNHPTTIYIKHQVSPYRSETLEIAANVTFLDTRFTAKEFGVSSLYTLSFIPTTQPTEMGILVVAYERPHPSHRVFIIFGILSSALGAIAIAYSMLGVAYSTWRKRRGTQTKGQVLT